MQLPAIAANFMQGIFQAANAPATGQVFSACAKTHTLQACGSEALRERYLPPLVEGRWLGTMCLSEPHAGPSLTTVIRCMAKPAGNGSYELNGAKMSISDGEQDIFETLCKWCWREPWTRPQA